ncbi:uncharacterized protein MAL13P1.304-like isoform X2 [Diorhabda carinulata]|uniref:uncharacterized protein MAL13P1.304-like isoform X2 n=1 Tax=Diorhabda carinulata TaxID=1163345 RepID=UPI0025A2A2BB|nr:uncharacterized protein MAL13P1.304-like isoform X2 [Diorhabda carinulata]
MTVLLLRKSAIVIFFCNIILTHQDFLENYKPRPGLPKPLNDWLTYVQEHKTDFNFINNIVKRRGEELDYYDETEEVSNNKLLGSNDDEYIDDPPKNDIYPHNSREIKENASKKFAQTLSRNNNNRKQFKEQNKSNISNRMRRESSKNSFFQKSNKLEIESNGKLGEIDRVGDKYPNQFRNKDQEEKREIQIDILNNGKLIKSVKESDKDSKSIVLDIDALRNPQNELLETGISTKKRNNAVIDMHVKPLQKSLISDNSQQDIIDREGAINYNNLFTVNKDLNTDRSVPKNTLVYHVTLSNINEAVKDAAAASSHNFYQNNFRDMSKYWTDSEKNQLRNGIQFAHNTIDLKNMIQTIPKTDSKINDGFEPVKSIVVDHNRDKEVPKQIQLHQSYVKRNSQTVTAQYKENTGISESSMTTLELTDMNQEKEELTTEAEMKLLLSQHQMQPHEHINRDTDEIRVETKEAEEDDHAMVIEPVSEESNHELFHHHKQPETENVHHGDENINNHIDINIIQPQQEEDKLINRPEHTHGNDLQDQKDTSIEERMELEKEIPLEEEIKNEKELEGEITNGDIETDEENLNGKRLEEEVIRKHKIKDEESRTGNGQDKAISKEETIEEIKQEVLNNECSEEGNTDDLHFEQDHIQNANEGELIEKYGHKQNKGNKGPKVKVQVDVSKYANNGNEAKKRNVNNHFPHHNTHHKYQNKWPNDCEGKNCYMHSSKLNENKQMENDNNNKQLPFKSVRSNKKKIKSHYSRKLKSFNYIYDTDIEAPSDEEYVEDEVSSEQSRLANIDKKDAVEGDYGDEEDSFITRRNDTNKIVKLTKNSFANPRIISSHEDDYDSDYYDEEAPTTKNKSNIRDNSHESTAKYRSREQTADFGRRRQHKLKLIPKTKKGDAKHHDAYNDKEYYVREPRSEAGFEDFQQLPKFVMNDRLTEENLRKRSLNSKQEVTPNKFPLSSKGFFTGSSKQNEFKRSDLNNGDISNKISVAPGIDKASTDNLATVTTIENNSNNGTDSALTLFDFHDLPGVSVTSTTVSTTTITDCEDSKIAVGGICETEKFNRSNLDITTMLSIIPEVQMELINNATNTSEPKEKFEKLDESLSGELPYFLVNSIYDHIKNDETFKTRLYKGMKRRYEKLPPLRSDDIQVVTQEQNRKMLNIMENIINKLEWNSNCQTIPKRYKQYLKSITKVQTYDALTKTKQMEEIDFDDTQNARNFLFPHDGDGTSSSALAQKAKILKDMLDKFEQLPPDCKARAEPVKKYVEEHLIMLDHVNNLIRSQKVKTEKVTETIGEVTLQSHQKPIRRNGIMPKDDLVEEQLESLGLGKNHNFKPKFDLDEMIQKSKDNIKRQHQEGKVTSTKQKKSRREN